MVSPVEVVLFGNLNGTRRQIHDVTATTNQINILKAYSCFCLAVQSEHVPRVMPVSRIPESMFPYMMRLKYDRDVFLSFQREIGSLILPKIRRIRSELRPKGSNKYNQRLYSTKWWRTTLKSNADYTFGNISYIQYNNIWKGMTFLLQGPTYKWLGQVRTLQCKIKDSVQFDAIITCKIEEKKKKWTLKVYDTQRAHSLLWKQDRWSSHYLGGAPSKGFATFRNGPQEVNRFSQLCA